jgi:Flp pilus assembly protein TadG
MRRWSWRAPWADDTGSALVEFTVLTVLLLVPLVYLVTTLARVEAGAFAVQRAAREAGRAYVAADSDSDGRHVAAAAADLAFDDQGFTDLSGRRLQLTCSRGDCHAPDSVVEVRTALDVVLPAVPRGLDRVVPLHIQLNARHVVAVDRFRAP